MTKQIKKKKKKKKSVSKDIDKKKIITPLDELKQTERIFCQEYIQNYGCGVVAYQKAFPKAKYNTAAVQANRLLKKPNIFNAINYLYTRLWREKDEEFTKSKVYQTIQAIANFDISDVIDLENGTLSVKDFSDIPKPAIKAIRSIKFTKRNTKEGVDENLEITMFDKLKALELLAKIQRMIVEKMEFEGEIIVKPAIRPKELEDKTDDKTIEVEATVE